MAKPLLPINFYNNILSHPTPNLPSRGGNSSLLERFDKGSINRSLRVHDDKVIELPQILPRSVVDFHLKGRSALKEELKMDSSADVGASLPVSTVQSVPPILLGSKESTGAERPLGELSDVNNFYETVKTDKLLDIKPPGVVINEENTLKIPTAKILPITISEENVNKVELDEDLLWTAKPLYNEIMKEADIKIGGIDYKYIDSKSISFLGIKLDLTSVIQTSIQFFLIFFMWGITGTYRLALHDTFLQIYIFSVLIIVSVLSYIGNTQVVGNILMEYAGIEAQNTHTLALTSNLLLFMLILAVLSMNSKSSMKIPDTLTLKSMSAILLLLITGVYGVDVKAGSSRQLSIYRRLKQSLYNTSILLLIPIVYRYYNIV